MKHLYKEYIKDRHYYLLSLLFIVFFADMFLLLYDAEINALVYLNISILIFVAVMTAFDYWRYRRLFRALVDFRKEPLIKEIVNDRKNLLKAYAVIIDDLKQIIKNSDEANEKKDARNDRLLYFVGSSDQNSDRCHAAFARRKRRSGVEKRTYQDRAVCHDGIKLS